MNNTKETTSADAFKITGDWAGQSKQLKAKYPSLTDADLKFETGKESEMLHRMELKLNKNREEVIAILKKNQSSHV
jgi:hypothetical protein